LHFELKEALLIGDSEIALLVEQTGVESQRTGGVLLVDDEKLNLTVLRGFLEDKWRVHEATSGAEALAIAAREPLDVVVSDQRMPGMTGVELLEELRHRRSDLAGIVLTAYADEQSMESAINRANVFRFLRKPWEPAEITQAIEQASAHVVQQRTIEKLVALLARRGGELRASLDQVNAQQRLLLHLERLSTIGRLASGITHDLKNVMVALRTADQELAETTTDLELRDIMTLGLTAIDNLLRTLQAVHEYARSGSIALQLDAVDASSVVSAALAITRADRKFKMRQVACDVAPGLPAMRADQQKLTQVMVNLVRNALHATEDGKRVRVSARARGNEEIELAVEDEGPGVPPELRERLFEPFVSTKGDQGLGLGLYMSRLIIESHHGRIALVDGPQRGARFEVVLPIAQSVNQQLSTRQ
jgi:signal transduction histidine kinase